MARPRKTQNKPVLPSNTSSAIAKRSAGTALDTTSATLNAVLNPSPLADPNTKLTSELNNINFEKMIGGPLQACVNAQVASSLATVDFINKVGFNEVDGKKELVMVDFSHKRKDVNEDGTANDKEVNIKVPLLAMLPIPCLRIDHVTIDFNVKLNSIESTKTESTAAVNTELKTGFFVKFKVSASYQRKSTTGVEVKKEYALNVNVKAVQEELPGGLEKILNILAA